MTVKIQINIYILFFLLLLNAVSLETRGQGLTEEQKLEQDIKLSGNYYWEQMIAENEKEGKSMAKEMLISQIFLENNDSIFMQNISYLVFPRGSRKRVIAYVPKDPTNFKQKEKKNDDEIAEKVDTLVQKTKITNNEKEKSKSDTLGITQQLSDICIDTVPTNPQTAKSLTNKTNNKPLKDTLSIKQIKNEVSKKEVVTNSSEKERGKIKTDNDIVNSAEIKRQELTEEQKLEEYIKLSGNYYWKQVIAKNEKKGKRMAKEKLINQILLENNDSIFMQNINYLVFPRGSRKRVIAYVPKDPTNFKQKEKKNDDEIAEKVDTLVQKTKITNNEKEKSKSDTLGITQQLSDICIDTVPTNPQTAKSLTNKTNNKPLKDTLSIKQIKNEVSKKEVVTNSSEKERGKIKTDNDIINSAIDLKHFEKIEKLLKTEKQKHRLAFGRRDDFVKPEKCYVLVFSKKTKELIAVLNKGDFPKTNIYSNKVIDNINTEFKNSGALWVQIIE